MILVLLVVCPNQGEAQTVIPLQISRTNLYPVNVNVTNFWATNIQYIGTNISGYVSNNILYLTAVGDGTGLVYNFDTGSFSVQNVTNVFLKSGVSLTNPVIQGIISSTNLASISNLLWAFTVSVTNTLASTNIIGGNALTVTNYGQASNVVAVLPYYFLDDPFLKRNTVWLWSGASGGAAPSVWMGPAVTVTGGSLIGVGSTNYGAYGNLTNAATAFDVASYSESFISMMPYQKPIFRIRFQLLNTNAQSIFYAGITAGSSSQMTTNAPLAPGFGIRASATGVDTTFKLSTSTDAVTWNVTDTLVPIDSNIHLAELFYCIYGASNVVMKIDGIFVATNSANIPFLNQQSRALVAVKTLDNAAKTNRFFLVHYQLNP